MKNRISSNEWQLLIREIVNLFWRNTLSVACFVTKFGHDYRLIVFLFVDYILSYLVIIFSSACFTSGQS
jgi:hypothetical protein